MPVLSWVVSLGCTKAGWGGRGWNSSRVPGLPPWAVPRLVGASTVCIPVLSLGGLPGLSQGEIIGLSMCGGKFGSGGALLIKPIYDSSRRANQIDG